MALFDIDFTLSITHTETFEADSLEEAQRIADALYETSWFSDYVTLDHDRLTLDHDRLMEYLTENKHKED